MNLKELLIAVRDEKLTLPMLEKYRDQLIHVRSDILMEIATLKKARAFFLFECEEPTMVLKRMRWEVTKEGQRLIELEGYIRGLRSEIDSLQSRIYAELRIA
jgi:hypothetical protein